MQNRDLPDSTWDFNQSVLLLAEGEDRRGREKLGLPKMYPLEPGGANAE